MIGVRIIIVPLIRPASHGVTATDFLGQLQKFICFDELITMAVGDLKAQLLMIIKQSTSTCSKFSLF